MSININAYNSKDFSLRYFCFGNGKKTFLMIPGLSIKSVMYSAEIIAQNYQQFNDEYTVYVPDTREDVPENYSIRQMSEEIVELINHLSLKDIYLFGASMGGMVSMQMSIDHPELIRKLLVGSSSSCVKCDAGNNVERWIELAKDKKIEELCLCFGENIYPQEVYEQYKGALSEMAKSVNEKEVEKFIRLSNAVKDFDVRDTLKNIDCPVLAIGSKDDKVFGPEASVKIVEYINKQTAQVYMYDNYGHAAYDVAPDYKQRIYEFFNE